MLYELANIDSVQDCKVIMQIQQTNYVDDKYI